MRLAATVIGTLICIPVIACADEAQMLKKISIVSRQRAVETKDLAQMKEEIIHKDKELAALRTALATTELKLASAAGVNSQAAVAASSVSPFDTLIGQLDTKGETVFFSGLGESRMASLGGQTILRFPLPMAGNADRMFSAVKADRRAVKDYVYYVLDSAFLKF